LHKRSSQIGDIFFPSKGEAIAFLRDMLHRYHPGDDVGEDDTKILRAALNNHPEAAKKIGLGVAGFKVRSADFGTKCFWVMRTDGSTEKFSHKACV